MHNTDTLLKAYEINYHFVTFPVTVLYSKILVFYAFLRRILKEVVCFANLNFEIKSKVQYQIKNKIM